MPLTPRAFRGPADWAHMIAVVQARPGDHLHVVDLPYRLCSWALDAPESCSLWEDAAGQVLAWAALQSPFWSIDYAIHPAAPPDTLQALLAWTDERARAAQGTPFGRPAWFISSFEGDPAHQTLEAFGFHSQADVGEHSWTKVLFRRDALPPPGARPLPDGFGIRPLNGPAEVDGYVSLHRAVFQSESMTAPWRRRTLAHPAYLPDLDLMLVDAEQQLAGFCIGWLTPRGPEQAPAGQIEPMGIRPDLQGRGLGQALLAECLARLALAGAEAIFVETDNYRDGAYKLYSAMGFRVARNVLVYRKDYVPSRP